MTVPPVELLLNRLRMRQVSLLLAIDELRTLRSAAQHLGMTQPAASKMLSELEDALGEPLFDRVGRGLALNPAGRAVTQTFRSLRNSVQALGRELRELHLGSSGRLMIGSINIAAPNFLGKAVIGLKKIYPLLCVEIHVDTSDRLIEGLREGRLDVVVGRLPEHAGPAYPDGLFRPIGDEALAIVVAGTHPILSTFKEDDGSAFSSLLDYPWVLQLRGSPLRDVIEQEFRARHAPLPAAPVETSSILTVIDLIAQSELIAVIPRSIAERFEQHGLLRILPYSFMHTLSAWGSLVRREQPLNAIVRRFLDLLHTAGRPATAWGKG